MEFPKASPPRATVRDARAFLEIDDSLPRSDGGKARSMQALRTPGSSRFRREPDK